MSSTEERRIAEIERVRVLETEKKRRYRAKLDEHNRKLQQEANSEQHRTARAELSEGEASAIRGSDADRRAATRAELSEGEASAIRGSDADHRAEKRESARSEDPYNGWERDIRKGLLRFWEQNATDKGEDQDKVLNLKYANGNKYTGRSCIDFYIFSYGGIGPRK